jgi:hypothetical protein
VTSRANKCLSRFGDAALWSNQTSMPAARSTSQIL